MESSTTINSCDEQKWEADEAEAAEEEALSLCDLPTNEENSEPRTSKSEEDFNFGSWSNSVSIKPEMCTPDEVFFKGQILPLHHPVNSDTSRNLLRSKSMDHGSLSRFTSVSSSSSTTTSSSNRNSMAPPKAIKIRNNFDTHPSPKPQIRLSKTRTPNVSSRNQRSSTLSMWDFFRLGLVRAPELELQDLKHRSNKSNDSKNSVSRNSSCNSSNSNNSSSTKVVNNKNQQYSNKGLLEERIGLFSGCKCSVNAVETVPSNNIVVAKSNKNNKNSSEKVKATATPHARSAIEEKKKKKQALSRHRTFEWIKELSHATYVDDA